MSINDIIDEALTLKPKDRYMVMSSLSKTNDDLSQLEKEVDKGINSKLSSKSHKEIFQNLKSKYV